jgi:ABC-type phosphate/phosphonate transport system substrate-binding protein
MKKQILIVTAAALTAAVVILSGTSAATAQQVPQYQVEGYPITPLQMSVLQPSAKFKEQQRLSTQRTMDASRRAVYPDPGLANTGY